MSARADHQQVAPPPMALIHQMVATGGADVEYVQAQELYLVCISSVDSRAWQLFKRWAKSIQGHTPTVSVPENCGPKLLQIEREAKNYTANLVRFVPLLSALMNVSNPLAILPLYLADPGPRFPWINAQAPGLYLCHVHYVWPNMVVSVPVFRKAAS